MAMGRHCTAAKTLRCAQGDRLLDVILSNAKDLTGDGILLHGRPGGQAGQMLRCAQHDKTFAEGEARRIFSAGAAPKTETWRVK